MSPTREAVTYVIGAIILALFLIGGVLEFRRGYLEAKKNREKKS